MRATHDEEAVLLDTREAVQRMRQDVPALGIRQGEGRTRRKGKAGAPPVRPREPQRRRPVCEPPSSARRAQSADAERRTVGQVLLDLRVREDRRQLSLASRGSSAARGLTIALQGQRSASVPRRLKRKRDARRTYAIPRRLKVEVEVEVAPAGDPARRRLVSRALSLVHPAVRRTYGHDR